MIMGNSRLKGRRAHGQNRHTFRTPNDKMNEMNENKISENRGKKRRQRNWISDTSKNNGLFRRV